MPVRLLKDFSANENFDTYDMNGTSIRMNIHEHFSREEIEAFKSRKFQYNYTQIPLSVLEYPSKIQQRATRGYAFALAFSRRITIPLMEAITTASVSHKFYPIDQLYNFQFLDEIFEKYYTSFDKLDTDNSTKKENFKERLTQFIFKLWLAGYGLLPNLTENHIDDKFLEELKNLHKEHHVDRMMKMIRFLGYCLSREDKSPVTTIPRIKEVKSVYEHQEDDWNVLLETYDTEITKELYNHCFNTVKSRIDKASYFEYTDKEGHLVRESLPAITHGTWKAYSIALIYLCENLNSYGYTTIEECIKGGIFDVYTNEIIHFAPNLKSNIKIVAKAWLNYYTKVNSIVVNIDRIIPPSIRNKPRAFGKIFDYGAALTLIETLLDDNSGYFDENKIGDYRARRACLLQLGTGSRASAVCYLKRDCIKTDNNGTPWLIFHKTKFSGENKVVATPDILKWIDELKAVAPEHKIAIPEDKFMYGDSLTEYRLLANIFDDGPMTFHSINSFLYTLQAKIWGDNHPNKKPFSSHDLRRFHAVFMKLNGRTDEDIRDQLGQQDIKSQVPYLQTKPVSHQRYFKQIQEKGVYNLEDNDSVVSIDNLIHNVAQFNDDRYNGEKITKLLLDASNDVKDFVVPEPQSSPLPSGFPLRVSSCTATMLTNCGHTELHCFKCPHYQPEIDSLEDHKTEIFRYMVLVLYQDKSVKKTKDELEKEVIKFRSSELNSLINECFSNLFYKFNLESSEITKIKNDLSTKAEAYIKKYIKKNPSPSFMQSKNFLLVGDIDGK